MEYNMRKYLESMGVIVAPEATREHAPLYSLNGTAARRIVIWPEIHARTGLSKSTVRRLEATGAFPKRRQLGPRRVGWCSIEFEQWISDRLDLVA